TSAELELCLALGKRAGCRFIWLSATVDPAFYARYLGSVEVLETRAFDPARAADVRVLPQQPLEFLNDHFMKRVLRERRGVAVFVPTRAEVERNATKPCDRWHGLPLGVDASELDLPVPLDRKADRDAVEILTERGLIERGRLTRYGREVEAMPVERPWGELLYHADPDLVPMVAVAASVESLHRMTREERDLRGLIVSGSDHLTAYNVYAEAVNKHGYLGEVYSLPRHLFRESVDRWAEGRGVLVKAIEDVALGLASVYRQLELPLPERLPHAGEKTLAVFADLVAKIQPFDLVIDEETADGREARVSRGSVCSSWGAV